MLLQRGRNRHPGEIQQPGSADSASGIRGEGVEDEPIAAVQVREPGRLRLGVLARWFGWIRRYTLMWTQTALNGTCKRHRSRDTFTRASGIMRSFWISRR